MALNFNGNTPKKILYNGLNVAKLVYNGVIVWTPSEQVLPDGYTQVEYIQGTGTQYIDIGRKMYKDSELELCFSFDEMQQNCSIFGSRTSSTVNNFEIASTVPDFSIYLDLGNYSTSRASYNNAVINTKYICTISKSLRAIYDENHTLLASNNTLITTGFATPSNARIFDTAGGYSANKLKGKVYYCKIWEKGVLARNMIPCKNQSNVAGLYDTVYQTFYTNAGSGSFIAGPVTSLPYGYTEVEYIESTGTQWIDTEYYPNNLTDVECKFMFNQLPSNTASSVFGVRDSDGSVQQFLTSVFKGVLWVVNGLNNTDVPSIRPLVNTEYILRITPQKAYWNGTEILTMTNSVANCPNLSMFMFGRHTRSGFLNQFLGKIYYFKIYEAGVLVRNFIPCKNPSNVAGMYDTVNGVFYSNAGTGTFIAGAEVETGLLRLRKSKSSKKC